MKSTKEKYISFIRKPFSGNGIRNRIFSLLFLVVLALPFVEDVTSVSPISGQSFFAKDQMISAVNNFKFHILGDQIFNGLIADQNGWLIYSGEDSLTGR